MATGKEILAQLRATQAALTTTRAALDSSSAMLSKATFDLDDIVNAPVPTPTPDPVPPDPTPVPVPVPGAKPRLWVDGGTLRTRTGAPCVLHAIELMYGPTSGANTAAVVKTIKDLGANAWGPLVQTSEFNTAEVRDLLTTARAAGIVTLFNVDHLSNGRAALLRPDTVAMLRGYDNVILECEVELGSGMTQSAWFDVASKFIRDIRGAGHAHPIKVGSPDGGRSPLFALQRGKDLLKIDPDLLFTWQAYWSKTSGWYQGQNGGLAPGIAGTLKMADQIAGSGLCFAVGLDAVDDVGDTGSEQLMARLNEKKVSWLWWVLNNGSDPNALVTDPTKASSATARGKTVSAVLKTSTLMPDLGVQ